MFSVDVRPYANKYVENNFHLNSVFCVLNQKLLQKVFEPRHEKTGFLPRRKQRRRSASR